MGRTAFFPDYLYASIYHLSSHILYLQNSIFRCKVRTRLQQIGRLLQDEQSKWQAIQTWANVIGSCFPLQFFNFVAAKELSDIRPKSYKQLCARLMFYAVFRGKAVPLHAAETLLCRVPSRLNRRGFEAYMQHGEQKRFHFLDYVSTDISYAAKGLSYNCLINLKHTCKWKTTQTMARGNQNTPTPLKGSWGRRSESKTSRMLDPRFAINSVTWDDVCLQYWVTWL